MNVTLPSTLVLQAIARGHHYGFEVMDATGLASGTVYPILRRLEQEGMLRASWEDARVAREEQRPPRRYYALTGAGEALLVKAKARFRMPADVPRARGFKTRPSES